VTGLCMILGIAIMAAACGCQEQKKMKFYHKGKTLCQKGDYAKAAHEFENAIKIDPRFADAHYMLGVVLQKEDVKAAYDALSKATELDPHHAKAQVQLGRILLVSGEPDKSLERVELALKDEPENEDALLLKGAIMIARKDPSGARKYMEELIKSGITQPDAFLILASACLQEQNMTGAEKALLKGIEANPQSKTLYLSLIDFYGRGKRFEGGTRKKERSSLIL
jgi:Tfp pilus assembly protein PilF